MGQSKPYSIGYSDKWAARCHARPKTEYTNDTPYASPKKETLPVEARLAPEEALHQANPALSATSSAFTHSNEAVASPSVMAPRLALEVTADPPQPPARVLEQAKLLLFRKRYHEALQLVQQAHQYFLEEEDPLHAMECQVYMAWLTYHLEGETSLAKVNLLLKNTHQDLGAFGLEPSAQAVWTKLLHYEGLIRYQQGLFGQAIRLFREAQSHCALDSLENARILDSLAVYYEHIGSFEKAIRLLRDSIAIKRQSDSIPELAITCQILGRLCLLIENLDEAGQYLAEARALSARLQDHVREASLFNDLIKITILKNDLAKATSMIAESETMTRQHKLKAEFGTTQLYKTFLLFLRQDFATADELIHKTILPIFEQFPRKKGYGIAKRLQSALFQVYGRRREAIEAMSEAIAIFQKQHRMDELAKTYFELGKLYLAMDEKALAQRSLMEALKIAERNSLAFLVSPIEDELFRLDTPGWESIVDKRVKHEPLFQQEAATSVLDNLLKSEAKWSPLEEGHQLPPADAGQQQQSPSGLLALLRLGQAMAAERELHALLQTVKAETERALDAERCTVFVYDADRNELWSQVASGLNDYDEIRFPAHMGLAGYVLKTGEVQNIADAYADPRFNKDVDRKTGYTTRNLLCVPIRNRRGDILGVFQVLNKRQASFGPADEDLLLAIAATAGMSIENALMAQEQKKAFESFIVTLSSTIDARDPITAGHSERVADYSLLIADELSMSNEEREVLKYASLLHDIGKIGIREEVLIKDGRLTVEEYRHIQEHARYTYDILRNIYFERHLTKVPEIAASHHEKMDGTGYFRGLRGMQIPLAGRILAISDVFDAITSRRHYRNRMPFDRVLSILRKDAGTHFDPDCVDLFFRVPVYRVAEVLMKERLFIKQVGHKEMLRYLDRTIRLEEFETILASKRRTKAEEDVCQLFDSIYYILPAKAIDNE